MDPVAHRGFCIHNCDRVLSDVASEQGLLMLISLHTAEAAQPDARLSSDQARFQFEHVNTRNGRSLFHYVLHLMLGWLYSKSLSCPVQKLELIQTIGLF